jgi:hypothetical protein
MLPEYMKHPDAMVSEHERAVAELLSVSLSDAIDVDEAPMVAAIDGWLKLEHFEELTDRRTVARLLFLFTHSGLRHGKEPPSVQLGWLS